MGLGSWAGIRADGKRAGKEAAIFPDFDIVFYNRIVKTVYDGQKFLTNLI